MIKFSKFLSYVLRHKPEEIGLNLDHNGWAHIDELITCAKKENYSLSYDFIQEVVKKDNKKRFIISECETKIRANQGHSIDIDLGLNPVKPPEILYHGTASRFLKSIMKQGLISGSRQYVHLSKDENTAVNVGKRHGIPIVLTIDAQLMYEDDHLFYISDNGIWLTKKVEKKYLNFLKK